MDFYLDEKYAVPWDFRFPLEYEIISSDDSPPDHVLTTNESENEVLMKKILLQEARSYQDPLICPSHLVEIEHCYMCDKMEVVSFSDLDLITKIRANMDVVKIYDTNKGVKFRFEFQFVCDGSPEEIFPPQDSNYDEALRRCDSIIRKLRRKEPKLLEAYNATFMEHEALGYMSRLSDKEIESLCFKPHHYIPHNTVQNLSLIHI